MTSDAADASATCPICAARGRRPAVYRLKSFDVIRCERCGALQRDPLPTAAEMESYYRDPSYIEGGYFAGREGRESPETAIFRETLGFLARRRVAKGLAPTGRVLDVGAGSGAFLELACEAGWEAAGVELSPELAARAASRSGAPVFRGDFARVGLGRAARDAATEAASDTAPDTATDAPRDAAWDAVTMWDVLEHTVDPGAFLDRAREVLAPDGVLVVFTIDAASLFNVVADLAWKLSMHRLAAPLELLYDKRHNHYFTSRTLATLLARHGFTIEHARTHRAHLGRWLSEPASRLVLAGAEVIDLLSVPLGRPYRQLLYCVKP